MQGAHGVVGERHEAGPGPHAAEPLCSLCLREWGKKPKQGGFVSIFEFFGDFLGEAVLAVVGKLGLAGWQSWI